MTGPPTPPPSSALEIQDAQREASVPPPAAAQSETTAAEPADHAQNEEPIAVEPTVQPDSTPEVATQSLNVYQLLFPTLADLASKGSYRELVDVAERADWNAEGDHHPSRLLIIAPLVLGYLILDDLPPARFALSRLPRSLESQPISHALFNLLASTSERRYEKIYVRAEQVVLAAQAFQIPGYELTAVIGALTTNFVDTFRRKTFALLSKAYSSLPLSVVQTYLGFTAEQAISVATEFNWSYDAQTQIFAPSASGSTPVVTNGFRSGPSSLATFGSLASGLILDTD
ncbi:unnamed protein product [Somion occarium]|uniref:CSN8/PSMD8/EIF3K domain-containing protein n=1 Tax=Somion occarium TaxID=3059160 RepID=A0ABP1DF27_9APHY